jgi:pantetheine-phosphate adenylyltransferase
MDVALGGTFDPIHDGHRALFDRALSIGKVTVGLTSDQLAPKTRTADRYIHPYEKRRRQLANELTEISEKYGHAFEIRQLTKPTGIATEARFDVIVVSPETRSGAEEVNRQRALQGHAELDIEVVPHVCAEDGDPISSTRIVRGEIDQHGNLTPSAEGRRSPNQR